MAMLREPKPRKRHAAVGVGRKLYVWAGNGDGVQAATLESFDVSSEEWEQPRQLRGPLPEDLRNMAVATDGKNAYSFGGACGPHEYLNKLYQIDLSTLQCRELVPTNSSPVPKKGSRMVYFNEKLVVYVGYLAEGGVIDELQVFDLKTSECEVTCTYICLHRRSHGAVHNMSWRAKEMTSYTELKI